MIHGYNIFPILMLCLKLEGSMIMPVSTKHNLQTFQVLVFIVFTPKCCAYNGEHEQDHCSIQLLLYIVWQRRSKGWNFVQLLTLEKLTTFLNGHMMTFQDLCATQSMALRSLDKSKIFLEPNSTLADELLNTYRTSNLIPYCKNLSMNMQSCISIL